MRVLGPEALRAALRPAVVLDAVRAALVAHAEGRTTVPAPVHLAFPAADGDAHVKVGMLDGAATFCVKLATGFYANAAHGRPSGGGALLVASATTGEVLAVLDDGGWITAVRTAAAAALATDALAPPGPLTLGVLGTGVQASLAAAWLRELRPVERVLVAGRSPERARRVAAEAGGEAVPAADLLAGAGAVVTATAARAPLFAAGALRPGTHVTALGADMPGKQELPAEALARADVVVDDLAQALDHGELGHAVRADLVRAQDAALLGAVLRDGRRHVPGRTTVADLTGVGALDAAVAERALGGASGVRSS